MPSAIPALRCHNRDSAGRRCRRPICDGHPLFCNRHVPPPKSAPPLRPDDLDRDGPATPGPDPDNDLSDELLSSLHDFRTAADINYTLGRLLILMAANRIPSRHASIMAYICQLLLQSLSLVETGGSHKRPN